MTPTERRIRARPRLLALVRKIVEARMLCLDDVCGRHRGPAAVAGRHECWWHLRSMGWSYPEIGRLWGVHHTTVMEAVKGWTEVDDDG